MRFVFSNDANQEHNEWTHFVSDMAMMLAEQHA